MILISTADETLAKAWQEALSQHTLYEKIAYERRQLEICLKKCDIELALVHLPMLGSEGINDISALHDISPETKLIILTPKHEERGELSAVLFGARAYLQDNTKLDLLKKVVTKVKEGEVWVDRKFVTRLLKEIEDIASTHHEEAMEIEKGIASMTPREEQIAELIATGASNRRIAEKLSISERTVKAHLGVIFKKIGIHDRLQLALYMNKYHQLSSLWLPRSPRN